MPSLLAANGKKVPSSMKFFLCVYNKDNEITLIEYVT